MRPPLLAAPLLVLACAPAAPPPPAEPPVAVTVATAAATRPPEPKAPPQDVSARRAVLNAACADGAIPEPDRAFYERLCADFDGNDAANARKRAFDHLVKEPNSEATPFIYLFFGDLFHRESAADPSKRALARQAYEKVLTYRSPFESYTHLALAGLADADGDAEAAIKELGLTLRTRGGWAAPAVQNEAMRGLGATWPRTKRSGEFGLFLSVHAFPAWQGVLVVSGYAAAGDRRSARAVFRTILDRSEVGEGCDLFRPLAAQLDDPNDPLEAPLRRVCR